MLSLSPSTRIFVAMEAMDMRRGFNGLYAWVQTTLGEEPTSGHWFVFLNKRRNRLKILTHDGSGLWLLNKRLEAGTFARLGGEGHSQQLRPEELTLLLHGLENASRRAWHRV
jgi:transposase